MKTYEEVKQSVLNERYWRVKSIEEWYEKEEKTPEVINAKLRKGEEFRNDIQFIDETTTFEIGRSINWIIKGLEETCQVNSGLYFSNYEQVISDVLLQHGMTNAPLTFQGSFSPSFFGRIKSECDLLGITVDDLICLKGTNPITDYTFGDPLRLRTNQIMGTNIPMAGELENAEKKDTATMTDEEFYQNYVERLELAHAAGEGYKHLELNEKYLEAKNNISGRSM